MWKTRRTGYGFVYEIRLLQPRPPPTGSSNSNAFSMCGGFAAAQTSHDRNSWCDSTSTTFRNRNLVPARRGRIAVFISWTVFAARTNGSVGCSCISVGCDEKHWTRRVVWVPLVAMERTS